MMDIFHRQHYFGGAGSMHLSNSVLEASNCEDIRETVPYFIRPVFTTDR
jgi:hypothetical protein